MAGRKDGRSRATRYEQVVQRITRCGRLRLHRLVACWLGIASRPGERCSEGKCPLSPPAPSQPPFHPKHDHRLRTCRARTVRPRRQPAYRDDQGLWRTVGSQAAQHPGSSAPWRGRRSSLGTGLRTCYPSGVLCGSSAVPSRVAWSHATGGTKTAAGMEEGTAARRARGRPEPVGRSVSPKPVSANPVRKERHLFSFAERATPRINDGAAHSRSQPRANAHVSAEASSLRCSLAPSATIEVAPRRGFARAGLAPVVLKPRRRGRGPTRLLSPGTDQGQLGRHR